VSDPHARATALLGQWADSDIDTDQRSLAQAYLSFLAARTDALWRSCVPGHLTASTLVLSADRTAVLLTLHPRVGRWVQLGGHCEPGDPDLVAAARREAGEESGLEDLVLDPTPVRLHVHPITCSLGVPTRHLDVQFRAYAPAGAVPRISTESADLGWHPVATLPERTDGSVRTLLAAALRG
jgi:8-oxo-dGTP pyrophosphatase MutT (NUDIX family)